MQTVKYRRSNCFQSAGKDCTLFIVFLFVIIRHKTASPCSKAGGFVYSVFLLPFFPEYGSPKLAGG